MKNLKIARTDAETILNNETDNYNEFLQKVLVKLNQAEKLSLKNFDRKFKTKINQKLKEKYLKKLRHLKLSYNIPSEESRLQGFERIKSKTQ